MYKNKLEAIVEDRINNTILKSNIYIYIYKHQIEQMLFSSSQLLQNIYPALHKLTIYCQVSASGSSDSMALYKLFYFT